MPTYTVGYATSHGPAGVDLTKTYDIPEFELGTMIRFTDGRTFRFVRTAAAKAQYSVYTLSNTWTVGDDAAYLVGITALAPVAFCVPQIAFSAPSSGYTYRYAWAQTAGAFAGLKLCAGTSKDNPLYLSSALGALSGVALSGQSCLVEAVKYTGDTQIAGIAGYSTSGACFSSLELFLRSDTPVS